MSGLILIGIFVPLLTAFVLLVLPTWPLKEERNKKKFLILISSGIGIGVILGISLYFIGIMKIYDSEVWNYKVTRIKHEEKWSKKESRTRQVPCGTDSKGNTRYRTETYYVTAYYGPYWSIKDEYGNWSTCNQGTYNKWKSLWGNEKRTGEHKGSATMLKTPITGGIFECKWPGTFETMFPNSSIHTYKNKVRESNSIFKFKEPTEELIKKYPRPADKGNTSPVLGGASQEDELLLRRINAEFGPKYQIHTILMLFHGQDRSVVDDVMSAWQGPNKNELVTFVGVTESRVQWCSVQSWMDNTTIHKSIENELVGEVWNINDYARALREFVPEQWERKEFADFEYIKISIHWAWKLLAVFIGIAVNIGLFFLLEAKMPTNEQGVRYAFHRSRY